MWGTAHRQAYGSKTGSDSTWGSWQEAGGFLDSYSRHFPSTRDWFEACSSFNMQFHSYLLVFLDTDLNNLISWTALTDWSHFHQAVLSRAVLLLTDYVFREEALKKYLIDMQSKRINLNLIIWSSLIMAKIIITLLLMYDIDAWIWHLDQISVRARLKNPDQVSVTMGSSTGPSVRFSLMALCVYALATTSQRSNVAWSRQMAWGQECGAFNSLWKFLIDYIWHHSFFQSTNNFRSFLNVSNKIRCLLHILRNKTLVVPLSAKSLAVLRH